MQRQSSAAQQNSLPKVQLQNLDGKKESLHQITRPSLILFFLPQSSTCQQQLEILADLEEEQSTKFEIIAVAIGDVNPKKLTELKKDYHLNYTLLIDNTAELSEKLKISSIPTLIFFHPQKKLRYKEGVCELKQLDKTISQEFNTQ